MSLTVFLLALGAVARLTRFFNKDYLARGLRIVLIRRFGPDHDLPYLVTCPWCLSVWVAGGVYTVAWFYGEHAGFLIPAAALSASYLYAIFAAYVDPIEVS